MKRRKTSDIVLLLIIVLGTAIGIGAGIYVQDRTAPAIPEGDSRFVRQSSSTLPNPGAVGAVAPNP